mgnify:CR=1 FL=1
MWGSTPSSRCSGSGRAQTNAPLVHFRARFRYRRLAGLLGRRGFDTGIITRVLADVLGE